MDTTAVIPAHILSVYVHCMNVGYNLPSHQNGVLGYLATWLLGLCLGSFRYERQETFKRFDVTPFLSEALPFVKYREMPISPPPLLWSTVHPLRPHPDRTGVSYYENNPYCNLIKIFYFIYPSKSAKSRFGAFPKYGSSPEFGFPKSFQRSYFRFSIGKGFSLCPSKRNTLAINEFYSYPTSGAHLKLPPAKGFSRVGFCPLPGQRRYCGFSLSDLFPPERDKDVKYSCLQFSFITRHSVSTLFYLY
jgi:hypothetical protein